MKTINISELVNKPDETTAQILNELMYGSYKSNRDEGLTHDQLLSIGIGNDEMKDRYENKEHFMECSICNKSFDMRDLSAVVFHQHTQYKLN